MNVWVNIRSTDKKIQTLICINIETRKLPKLLIWQIVTRLHARIWRGGVLKIQTVKIHIVKLWKIRSVRLDFICKTNIRRMHRLTFGNRLVASFDRKVRWRTPILIAGLKRPVWNLPFFQVWRKLLIRWCTEIKKNVDIC